MARWKRRAEAAEPAEAPLTSPTLRLSSTQPAGGEPVDDPWWVQKPVAAPRRSESSRNAWLGVDATAPKRSGGATIRKTVARPDLDPTDARLGWRAGGG